MKGKTKKSIYVSVFFKAIFYCVLGGGFIGPLSANAAENKSLDQYVSYFYNREASHFQANGEYYQMPDYGIRDPRPADSPRKNMEFGAFYKYKALGGDDDALNEIRQRIKKVTLDRVGHANQNKQSFEGAIANFFVINYLNILPDLFSPSETKEIRQAIGRYVKSSLKTSDTENRAAIAAAGWQIVADDLYANGIYDSQEKKQLDILIKQKMERAIKQSVNKDFWYLESGRFSPHYHLVAAFMLMVYGDTTKQKKYVVIAREMAENIRKITFQNGMIASSFEHRPAGNGAQTYLMAGILNKRFHFSDYGVYLAYADKHRFFSDKKHPNRLEFHSAVEGSDPVYHDDLGFALIAEMALSLKSLQPFIYKPAKRSMRFRNRSSDNTFWIFNNGKYIAANNFRYNLGSHGNWHTFARLK